jgi:hypothetical protein
MKKKNLNRGSQWNQEQILKNKQEINCSDLQSKTLKPANSG